MTTTNLTTISPGSPKTLIIIVGPTAIGKTDLAIKVARHFNTEIVSADSRQFYREMSIGTAKPSPEELQAIKHHFIDSLSVTEDYSAGHFETDALSTLEGIFRHKDVAVLIGGSGLFVKAVTEGFDDLPKAAPSVRKELNQLFSEEGIPALQERLKELDPTYYRQVDINNPQRLIRALEVCITTGKPFSDFTVGKEKERPFNMIKIGLNTDRDILYQRINQRVDLMLQAGLEHEVRTLLPFRNLNALNTVGYTEIFEYLDGKVSLQQAADMIKQNTRRFAKRQLTWFRKDPEILWFGPAQYDSIITCISSQVTNPHKPGQA